MSRKGVVTVWLERSPQAKGRAYGWRAGMYIAPFADSRPLRQ